MLAGSPKVPLPGAAEHRQRISVTTIESGAVPEPPSASAPSSPEANDPIPMFSPVLPVEPAIPLATEGLAFAGLEATLREVEFRLAALGEALQLLDAAAIDSHAAELHRALAQAIACFSDAARAGPVALALRQRLAAASGRVAAHRNTLAQATAALDRAIDVLLPERGRASDGVPAPPPARAG